MIDQPTSATGEAPPPTEQGLEGGRRPSACSARAAFEEWMTLRSDLARPLDRFGGHTRAGNPGDYKDAAVSLAWEAWQASRQNTEL